MGDNDLDRVARRILQRKAELGRRASYRELARNADEPISHMSIQRALKNLNTGLPYDRGRILRLAEKALLRIELKSLEESEA